MKIKSKQNHNPNKNKHMEELEKLISDIEILKKIIENRNCNHTGCGLCPMEQQCSNNKDDTNYFLLERNAEIFINKQVYDKLNQLKIQLWKTIK